VAEKRWTPAEIAELISEDVSEAQPASGMGGVGSGTMPLPLVDVSGATPQFEQPGDNDHFQTTMRACSAECCAYNIRGEHCELETIDIDDKGGCVQYQLAEDEYDDTSRYQEEEVDVGDMTAQPHVPAMHNPAQLSAWSATRVTPYDPMGSAQ